MGNKYIQLFKMAEFSHAHSNGFNTVSVDHVTHPSPHVSCGDVHHVSHPTDNSTLDVGLHGCIDHTVPSHTTISGPGNVGYPQPYVNFNWGGYM